MLNISGNDLPTNAIGKNKKDEKLINDIIHYLICLTFPDERFTNECNRKK
jgi:hypothetical protein